MDEKFLTKNCNCESTGSGPRSIPIYEADKIVAYAYVQKACDKCDKPYAYARLSIKFDERYFNTDNEVMYK